MAKYPYRCNPKLYENYYLQQTGGQIPVFIGGRGLHGAGLGNIFGAVLRSAMPLLKQGGKALLREGARAGTQLIGDVLGGESLKSAAKKRSQQVGKNMLTQAVNQLTGSNPPKRIKLTSQKRRRQKRGKKKGANKSKQYSDIFN